MHILLIHRGIPVQQKIMARSWSDAFEAVLLRSHAIRVI